jgi:hypothetical protein
MQPAGHHYGALYTQALVPYQCASVSGQKDGTLKAICREIGNLIVTLYKRYASASLRREVTERIVSEYMEAASDSIWGGREGDIVWKTFYK